MHWTSIHLRSLTFHTKLPPLPREGLERSNKLPSETRWAWGLQLDSGHKAEMSFMSLPHVHLIATTRMKCSEHEGIPGENKWDAINKSSCNHCYSDVRWRFRFPNIHLVTIPLKPWHLWQTCHYHVKARKNQTGLLESLSTIFKSFKLSSIYSWYTSTFSHTIAFFC